MRRATAAIALLLAAACAPDEGAHVRTGGSGGAGGAIGGGGGNGEPPPLTGDVSCLKVTPTRFEFNDTTLGCAAHALAFAVENGCAAPATLALDVLPEAGPFRFAQQLGDQVTVAPGERLEGAIAFAPDDAGPAAGLLVVDAGNGPDLEIALRGAAVEPDVVTLVDEFPPEPRSPIDILIVLDDSTALAPFHAWGAAGLAELLAMSSAYYRVDVRIAVTTMSFERVDGCGGEAGILVPSDGSHPQVLTHETPDLQARLEENLQVGTCAPAGAARGIDAAILAAEGFVRPEAWLSLLLVSAQDDASSENVASARQRLAAVHPAAATGVFAALPDAFCRLEEAPRFRAFVEGFEAGGIGSICSGWYPATISTGVTPLRVLPLSAAPIDRDGDGEFTEADGVRVSFNGADLPRLTERGHRNWSYEPGDNSIHVWPFAPADLHGTFTVEYTAYDPAACP